MDTSGVQWQLVRIVPGTDEKSGTRHQWDSANARLTLSGASIVGLTPSTVGLGRPPVTRIYKDVPPKCQMLITTHEEDIPETKTDGQHRQESCQGTRERSSGGETEDSRAAGEEIIYMFYKRTIESSNRWGDVTHAGKGREQPRSERLGLGATKTHFFKLLVRNRLKQRSAGEFHRVNQSFMREKSGPIYTRVTGGLTRRQEWDSEITASDIVDRMPVDNQ
ncbi:hypothetical protein B0H17DRAFT_1142591 [Mycena rosella]|uniref:Uncharacterized protein n=1 Tax=Mycena rosella TaxID=1033263 RepID=A0AAD7CX18_MYCRO|nr:hypothetical protein B0H17DRAFT_1142591 [Mycena rosella]